MVAVVLVAGGIWLFSVGGEDGNGPRGSEAGVPGGSHAKQLFSLEQPDTHVKDAQGADGSWATEKIYAKSSINAIEGYRMNGERAWRIPLGGPVCAASPHMTDDHRTAVAFEKGSGGCNSVAVFDVDTGKKLWDQPIPIGRTIFGGGDVNLTVAQDTVALSWIGGFAAFPIEGGDPLWKSKETGETCEHSRYGGGARLLVVLECDESLTLNQLDPKTGHSTWDMRLPHNLKDGRAVRIVDTDPIVLVLGIGGRRIGVGGHDDRRRRLDRRHLQSRRPLRTGLRHRRPGQRGVLQRRGDRGHGLHRDQGALGQERRLAVPHQRGHGLRLPQR
ncbi:PQQ-binding-like beta-propeller repeat protein [Streptomyces sp. GKU 257-1]|nr:PQQ-binding-like beta-propeller repeat protein [Streptomyces sp. GKU 257-1]